MVITRNDIVLSDKDNPYWNDVNDNELFYSEIEVQDKITQAVKIIENRNKAYNSDHFRILSKLREELKAFDGIDYIHYNGTTKELTSRKCEICDKDTAIYFYKKTQNICLKCYIDSVLDKYLDTHCGVCDELTILFDEKQDGVTKCKLHLVNK